jgi:hypothetical protein
MTPAAIVTLLPLAISSIQTGRRLFEEIRDVVVDLRRKGEIDEATQDALFQKIVDAEQQAQSGRYPDHMIVAPDPEG